MKFTLIVRRWEMTKWILSGYRKDGTISMVRCDSVEDLLDFVNRWSHRFELFEYLKIEEFIKG